jgi:transcriptional regulator with XRE-family HTH domain
MNKIKALRIKYELTQKQIAARLDKSERQIQYLEAGVCKITKDVMFRLNILEKELEKELAKKSKKS